MTTFSTPHDSSSYTNDIDEDERNLSGSNHHPLTESPPTSARLNIKEDSKEASNLAQSNIPSTQASGSQEPPDTAETFQLDDCFAEPLESYDELNGPLYTFYEFLRVPESPSEAKKEIKVEEFDNIPLESARNPNSQEAKNRIVADWIRSQALNGRQNRYLIQDNETFQNDLVENEPVRHDNTYQPQNLSFRHHRDECHEPSIMTRFFCCFHVGDHREDQYKVAEPCPEPQKYSWDKERPDPKDFMFTNLENEVRVKKDGEIGGQQFVIENCKNCCLLLLDHSASITVDDCTDCLIVIGPCKGSVFIRDCRSCLVYTICQQFRTRDCELGVFLFCATAPIIEESTVEFFPLRLHYNKIDDHMIKAGLSPFTNLWSKVHDFTPNGREPRFTLYKEPTPGSLSDLQRSKISKIFGIEGLSFHEKESYLFLTEADRNPDPTMERVLVLCKLLEGIPSDQFYKDTVLFLRDLLIKHHLKLLTTKDFTVQKGELQTILQSKSAKHTGRIITIEITGSDARSIITDATKHLNAKEIIEIVPSDKTNQYKEKLYRLAEVQNSV